jgi:hypothetical protein
MKLTRMTSLEIRSTCAFGVTGSGLTLLRSLTLLSVGQNCQGRDTKVRRTAWTSADSCTLELRACQATISLLTR